MKFKQQVHKIQDYPENKYQNKDFETEQNLREFFYLLLKIDKRNHPEYYKKPKNNQENEKTNYGLAN